MYLTNYKQLKLLGIMYCRLNIWEYKIQIIFVQEILSLKANNNLNYERLPQVKILGGTYIFITFKTIENIRGKRRQLNPHE